MLRQRHVENSTKQQEDVLTSVSVHMGRKYSQRWFLKFVALVFLVLYIVIPFAFYLSPALRRHAVFLNYVSLSRNKNLSLPTEIGLNCTRNFYISSENDIKLGVWHIPPYETLSRCKHNHLPLDTEFLGNRPVFLYLHGNAGTRGGAHRVQLYKVLSEKVNAHVIAFDYRGFGDSTNVPPSADGLVHDTNSVYDWLRQHVDQSRIFIWGHSLGTGVGTAFLEKLSTTNKIPAGLILEAPFTKLIDAAKHHPLSFLHRHMPFFDFFFSDPIGQEDTEFNSESRIGQVSSPLLILHAEDDGFVPFEQGKRLYEKALAERAHNLLPAQFVGFDRRLDYGHKHIYKEPSLPDIIKQFMEKTKSFQSKA